MYDDDTHASFTEQNTNNIVNAAPVDDQIQAELGLRAIRMSQLQKKTEKRGEKEQDDERKDAAQEDAKEKERSREIETIIRTKWQ